MYFLLFELLEVLSFFGFGPPKPTGFTGGLRLLSSSIDLSNPRWKDWAYGELRSS